LAANWLVRAWLRLTFKPGGVVLTDQAELVLVTELGTVAQQPTYDCQLGVWRGLHNNYWSIRIKKSLKARKGGKPAGVCSAIFYS
jgi:hypothetical protein